MKTWLLVALLVAALAVAGVSIAVVGFVTVTPSPSYTPAPVCPFYSDTPLMIACDIDGCPCPDC